MSMIAIIVAAGSGTRFGARKQFAVVAGHPLYYYAIKAFRPYAEHIILVVPGECVETTEGFGAMVIAGGEHRYDSVYNAVRAVAAIDDSRITDDSVIMIHDGARPAITADVIERVIRDAENCGAAAAAVPVTDTIRTVDGELIDRSELRAMQTPQCFKYGLLRESYEKLMSLPREAIGRMNITDDVETVSRMSGVDARLTEGDPRNIKVTTPYDIENLHLY